MRKSIIKNLLLISSTSLFSTEFITLGTGEENGTYYPVGLSMCKFINKKQKNMRCSIESTNGAIYNINAVLSEKFNFAISQSDTIYHVIYQEKNFKNRNTNDLRSVISIYPELFAFIVNKRANINKIEDIKGKRINIGSLNSGSELTTLEILNEYKIKKTDLAQVSSLDAMDTVDALRDDIIDGYFFMVGHPTQNIQDAIDSSDISIIPIKGKEIDSLIKKRSYFKKSYIDANLYDGIEKRIETIGSTSVIITNKKVSEELVYNFIKIIMENFDEFKQSNEVFKNITKKSLFQGLTAPQHSGVIKYLKENNITLHLER